MFRVFLGLGSNVGDSIGFLGRAVTEIGKIAQIRAVSSIYETEPVGYRNQPWFLNMVVEIETGKMPRDLLAELKGMERRVGRRRVEHLQPREIDIDILLYIGLSYADESVTVPHPELHRRRFVLEPLNEIAPEAVHPSLNVPVSDLLGACTDPNQVIKNGTLKLSNVRQASS